MTCTKHPEHAHTHGVDCGHVAIQHGDHACYLHDGHMHRVHDGHVDEHTLEVGPTNPDACTPAHAATAHDGEHEHGSDCGHEAVPHGDHVDYLVDGHLHHPHGGHCDDHGPVELA